jgi:hypothetical protein
MYANKRPNSNVASACGLTPQYTGFESVYEKFRARGDRSVLDRDSGDGGPGRWLPATLSEEAPLLPSGELCVQQSLRLTAPYSIAVAVTMANSCFRSIGVWKRPEQSDRQAK